MLSVFALKLIPRCCIFSLAIVNSFFLICYCWYRAILLFFHFKKLRWNLHKVKLTILKCRLFRCQLIHSQCCVTPPPNVVTTARAPETNYTVISHSPHSLQSAFCFYGFASSGYFLKMGSHILTHTVCDFCDLSGFFPILLFFYFYKIDLM